MEVAHPDEDAPDGDVPPEGIATMLDKDTDMYPWTTRYISGTWRTNSILTPPYVCYGPG